jgi:hypothetical protein
MQFGFSTPATREWFGTYSTAHYLLGFSHTENTVFAAPLLAKLSPRARVYIINAEGFFDDRVTPPVAEIFHSGDSEREYRVKKLWQPLHLAVCGTLPAICGGDVAFLRDRRNGHWRVGFSIELPVTGVADTPPDDDVLPQRIKALAEEFVANLPVERNCVLLTIVPSPATARVEARAIADAVGAAFIAPESSGLQTFDGSHLDQPSAQRWAHDFFSVAGPLIRRCLDNRVAG